MTIRHGKTRREWATWHIVLGCLIGMVVGIWIFAGIWGAIR